MLSTMKATVGVGVILAICLLSGCLKPAPELRRPPDPGEQFRQASREAHYIRDHLFLTNNEEFSRSHDRRRLNDALERKDRATDERFLQLERRLSALAPSPLSLCWTVIRPDGSTAYASSPGSYPVDGEWTLWAQSGGRKLRQLVYSGGKRNGPAVNWNKNGQKISSGQYLDDEKHGVWITYGLAGKIITQTVFENGKVRPTTPPD